MDSVCIIDPMSGEIEKLARYQIGHHASRKECQCEPCKWAAIILSGLDDYDLSMQRKLEKALSPLNDPYNKASHD